MSDRQGSRQSGRTTTIVEHARRLNDQGFEVIVVGSTYRHCKQLQKEVGTGCTRVSYQVVTNVSMELLIDNHAPGKPDAVVLVDHHAWETRMRMLFNDSVKAIAEASEAKFELARLKRAAFAFIQEPFSPRAKLDLEKLLGSK